MTDSHLTYRRARCSDLGANLCSPTHLNEIGGAQIRNAPENRASGGYLQPSTS